MKYDKDGKELPDSRPVEVPLHFRRPPSLHDDMKRFIRSELSRQAEESGAESFEDANDFDVLDGEDADVPLSAAEREALLAEEFRLAKQDMEELDGLRRLQENVGAVNGDRTKEVSDGNGNGKDGKQGVDSASGGDSVDGAVDAGKKS